MPQLTPLGVARQMTMNAAMIRDAVEEALVTTHDFKQERIADAILLSRDLTIWVDFAAMRGWDLVVKHGMAQVSLANASLGRLDRE